MVQKYISECEIQGKKITVETGYLAKQSDSSVLVSSGDNKVLVTVVSSKQESDKDFFPLTIEYQERFYSVGRVPGGFFKREGRPSNEAILNARLIDRPIRPCFPENYRADTQIVATILSSDGLFPLEILSGIGASTALHISHIPFNGPVAFLKVSLVKEEWVLNPQEELSEPSDMDLIVAGTSKGLLMVEGFAQFVSEEKALSTLKFAHESMRPIFDMQEDLRKKTGSKAKREVKALEGDSEMSKKVEDLILGDLEKALSETDKVKRYGIFDEIKEKLLENFSEEEELVKKAMSVFEDLKYQKAREKIINKTQRIDGRKMDEVRPITCEVDILPRAHGSALFTRGETQVLGALTLGTGDDEKIIDNLWNSNRKKFFLHYNFPPFCVGETGRMGGQSRREIGHGFLAEKALKAVIPSHETFPYTIRLVSEVLESNGSSSMGTVCSGMMALMAGGVPVKDQIAGIAMGLIKEGDKLVVLSDILGDEDHLGDMDFKVAGSQKGITALQMDIKIDSIDFDTIEKALQQALKGRQYILSEMQKSISSARPETSDHAPKIETLKIHPDKIREVIGSGGKTINSITEETGVKIDIEDDGTLFISSVNKEGLLKAKKIIEGICEEVEEGKIYEGVVTGIKDFGAFVEILPKTSGLLHISQISHKRIAQVSDVLKEGDKVKVKVLNVEGNGRIRLSAKAIEEKSLQN
ncbi:MAG: polyribonucleotide nucleotidyltransferase [Bdellovibrionaceae bacterium]|nr:polyribonucleotide nucleotidyltransferase [Pseudobdellovibrionaceae bacterium]